LQVAFAEVLKNKDGKSKGVAIVEMVTKQGATKCIDVLNRQVHGGRTLSAKEIRVGFWLCFTDAFSEFLGFSLVIDYHSIFRVDFPTQMLEVPDLMQYSFQDPPAFFRRIKEESGIDFLGGAGDRRESVRRRPLPERRPSPGLRSNDTYGLSTTFLDSLGLRPPLVNRVFVTNVKTFDHLQK
jgi:hypothetical protein